MPEKQPSLDERIAAVGERAEPASPRRSVLPPPEPLRLVRVVLMLFAFVAALLLVQDVVWLVAAPDEHVFVSVEGQRFHVWPDVGAYEGATGKRWFEQPSGTTELVALYHGAQRAQALTGGGLHLLFLALSVAALRRLRQVRSGPGVASGPSPGRSEAAAQEGSAPA